MSRTRLPNRRSHQVAVVNHNGFKLIVGIGRFDDGRIGELFIDTCKGGTALDTILRDSAILTSLALQAGIGVNTIRAAVANNGPVAAVLDHLGDESP
jgi:ribonucleoside-diphosphate reductase alpha chain